MRLLAATVAVLMGLAAGTWGAVGYLYAGRPAPRHAPVTGRGAVMYAATVTTPPRSTCAQYWRIAQDGGRYQVRDDYFFRNLPVCVRADGAPGFTVTRTTPGNGKGVLSYPNVFSGCEQVCTRDSRLPRRISGLGSLTVTDDTTARAAGVWNDAVDMWVDTRPIRHGQARTAEVMIWLKARGFTPAGTPVTIGGTRYRLNWWRTRRVIGGKRVSWPLLIFTRTRPVSSVSVRIAPVLAYVARMGLLSERDWLLNAEAGFELWSGGRGLAVTHFAVWTPKPPRPPVRHLPKCPAGVRHCPKGGRP